MSLLAFFQGIPALAKWVPRIEAIIVDLLRDVPALRDAIKKIIADIEADLLK